MFPAGAFPQGAFVGGAFPGNFFQKLKSAFPRLMRNVGRLMHR